MNDTWYDMGFDADMGWMYDWKEKEKKMAISESKKKIVIDNYFKKECDVNTSIKEAFTKGFELGLKKALVPTPKTGHWIIIDDCEKFTAKCSECGQIEDSRMIDKYAYCHCGARMVEPQDMKK